MIRKMLGASGHLLQIMLPHFDATLCDLVGETGSGSWKTAGQMTINFFSEASDDLLIVHGGDSITCP